MDKTNVEVRNTPHRPILGIINADSTLVKRL